MLILDRSFVGHAKITGDQLPLLELGRYNRRHLTVEREREFSQWLHRGTLFRLDHSEAALHLEVSDEVYDPASVTRDPAQAGVLVLRKGAPSRDQVFRVVDGNGRVKMFMKYYAEASSKVEALRSELDQHKASLSRVAGAEKAQGLKETIDKKKKKLAQYMAVLNLQWPVKITRTGKQSDCAAFHTYPLTFPSQASLG